MSWFQVLSNVLKQRVYMLQNQLVYLRLKYISPSNIKLYKYCTGLSSRVSLTADNKLATVF
jgi:hypothetical protein